MRTMHSVKIYWMSKTATKKNVVLDEFLHYNLSDIVNGLNFKKLKFSISFQI